MPLLLILDTLIAHHKNVNIKRLHIAHTQRCPTYLLTYPPPKKHSIRKGREGRLAGRQWHHQKRISVIRAGWQAFALSFYGHCDYFAALLAPADCCLTAA